MSVSMKSCHRLPEKTRGKRYRKNHLPDQGKTTKERFHPGKKKRMNVSLDSPEGGKTTSWGKSSEVHLIARKEVCTKTEERELL